MTYSVLYSVDGVNWRVLKTNITETQLQVDPAHISGGDNVWVCVLVSDGVNTSYDDSDTFFSIEKKVPSATIISPDNGDIVATGSSFWLDSYAFDLEDGILDNSFVSWESDVDGVLGTGTSILASLTTPTLHFITLTVADSDGNTNISVLPIISQEATRSILAFSTITEFSLDTTSETPRLQVSGILNDSCTRLDRME